MEQETRVTGWVGWIWFAGMMMIMVGLFNVMNGLLAIVDDTHYIAAGQRLLMFDSTGWGWVHLIIGLVVVVTGIALAVGQPWARIAGVVLVMLNAFTQMAWIAYNPWWSLIVIAIDVLIIYAIIVHGREAETLKAA